MSTNQAAGRWEHFPHEADVGIRGFAPSLEGAFIQVALGLTAVVSDPERVRVDETVEVACSAPDRELLLVDWVNRVVYQMATRDMLFARYDVVIRDGMLEGRLHGERVDVARHQPAVEVKGATYTALRIVHEGGRWMAQCVVDV